MSHTAVNVAGKNIIVSSEIALARFPPGGLFFH